MFSSITDDDNPFRKFPSRPLSKPNVELAPNTCPRCASSSTKFCYYNNYSLSQPRYFCKGCRRYWTKGGSLRNVPVGGGCRKRRRRAKSSSSATNVDDQDARQAATSTVGAEIDLAAVFAKFLGHQDYSGNEEEVVNDQDPVFECKNPSDLMDTLQMGEGFSVNAQDLVELQSILDDETRQQNMLLSYDTIASFPLNCAWQPMLQLDDFGSFSIDDDHMKMSADVVSESWIEH